MSSAGAALSTWLGSTGSVAIVLAATMPPGATFGAATRLSGTDTNASAPQSAIDRDGDGIAIWSRGATIEVTGHDSAGPQLRGLTGPATARAQAQTAWSVTPLDVWSGVSSVSWDFGDGASAAGSSAVHAYDTPGPRTVTVTATDTLGNTSRATLPISVGPPLDADGDGFIPPADCDDSDKTINPAGVDVPRDGIDQDCRPPDADFPPIGSTIFSTYAFKTSYTRFTTLGVRQGKAGSTIRVTCSGGGCRFKSNTRQIARDASEVKLDSVVRSSKIRPGSELVVRVTKPGTIGAMRIVTVRRGKVPTRLDLCLDPDRKAPQSCDGRPVPVLRIVTLVRYGFSYAPRYTLFPSLSVQPGLPGSTIRVRCTGRGCRFKSKTRTVKRYVNKVVLSSFVRGARLRPGAKLEVRVTKSGKIGFVRTLTVRSGKAPLEADRCIAPGAKKTMKCPPA